MFSFEEIIRAIESSVRNIKFSEQPRSLFEPITYSLSVGGKRIRPALLLMSYNLYKEDIAVVMNQALGIEVFHNFTLLHDDLMDEAEIRRGKPTVHKVWNANSAILSGDAMLIEAYRFIEKTDGKHLNHVLNLFTQTALEVCCGQQYDMEFESRSDVTEAEYLEMIRLKTAVLLASALKIGALLADASEGDSEHLYQFGIALGLAFQLQDDLLDVYGDPAVFGKKNGGDILCDKKTFLLINAFNKANEQQMSVLKKWIGCDSSYNPQDKINAVMKIYDELQLKRLSEKKIEEYFNNAMSHLDALAVDAEKLTELKRVSGLLMNRKF